MFRKILGVTLLMLVAACSAPLPEVVSVRVLPANVTLQVGDSVQLDAVVSVNNGASTDVSWSSSNTSVVWVDSTGLVTAYEAGVANVVATSEFDSSKSSFSVITVLPYDEPQPGQVTLVVNTTGNGGGNIVASQPAGLIDTAVGKNSANINIGELVTLVATPNSGSSFEGWTGCGSATGNCVLTMDTTRNVSAKFEQIPGVPQPVVVSVTITPTSPVTTRVDQAVSFSANVVVQNGASTAVIWSVTSGTGLATINPVDGVMVPVQPGIVYVTATSQADQTKFDSVTVTISPLPEETPIAEPIVLYPGVDTNFTSTADWFLEPKVASPARGGYLDSMATNHTAQVSAHKQVTIPAGQYYVYARTWAPGANGDAFYFGIDNDIRRRFHDNSAWGNWYLLDVTRGNPFVLPTTANNLHKVGIGSAEPGLVVYAIAIVDTRWEGNVLGLFDNDPVRRGRLHSMSTPETVSGMQGEFDLLANFVTMDARHGVETTVEWEICGDFHTSFVHVGDQIHMFYNYPGMVDVCAIPIGNPALHKRMTVSVYSPVPFGEWSGVLYVAGENVGYLRVDYEREVWSWELAPTGCVYGQTSGWNLVWNDTRTLAVDSSQHPKYLLYIDNIPWATSTMWSELLLGGPFHTPIEEGCTVP